LGLGTDCRVAVAEYPHDGGSLDDLVSSAESMLMRARFDDGPRVVSADSQGSTAQGADVLVVDPDATLRALVVTLLERDDMTVVQLNDGVAALEYLTGHRERALPRVMLMELDLMGMDGLALLRKLRDAGVLSRMRVLVLTARIREAELLEALELGASDYVTKPFAPALLLHRLRRVMAS
jgi:CheY-like chemotaxis protein